jgi:poly(A) polymerase
MEREAEEVTEREFAIDVVKRLQRAGYEALWAGGCVRDQLLGLIPHDYDVATSARPEQVQELFRRSIAVGASFGVIEVLGPRVGSDYLKVQVATFRADGEYIDGRWPTSVTFCSAREDALRRDFTINGMFFNPIKNELIDYVGGKADLEAKVLRAIGDARQRFTEDKLRLLRAVRFAARFELALDPATAVAVAEMADQLPVVSAERIADEMRKLLANRHRARGLRLLDDVGLLPVILPEVARMHGVPQGLPAAPTGDLWQHTLAVVEQLPAQCDFPLAFATVLHDVGKPVTIGRTPDRYTFHSHEHAGREIAEKIADRLKLANVERDRIGWLVEKHQYLSDAPAMRKCRLKPVLAHPGIADLLMLHRADALGSGRSTAHVEFAEAKLREWTENGELNPPPLLTGDDLKAMGIPPGKVYKRILDMVRDGQLDGTLMTKEQAAEFVRRLDAETL